MKLFPLCISFLSLIYLFVLAIAAPASDKMNTIAARNKNVQLLSTHLSDQSASTETLPRKSEVFRKAKTIPNSVPLLESAVKTKNPMNLKMHQPGHGVSSGYKNSSPVFSNTLKSTSRTYYADKNNVVLDQKILVPADRLIKAHLAYIVEYPLTCPCVQGKGFVSSECHEFITKGSFKCRKRKCHPKFMCVIGAKSTITCMRRTIKSKIVPNGDGTCFTKPIESKKSFTYVPYSA